MIDYRNDLVSFVKEVWTTEDFCQPRTHEGLRGTKIEKLPEGKSLVNFNINHEYEIDWPILDIEEEINKEFGKELARMVDEEIMKSLFGTFMECETYNWNRPPVYPSVNSSKIEPKYSHYDSVMNSVINISSR